MPSGPISHTAGLTFEDFGLTFYDPQGVGKVRENAENIELAHALKGTWDSSSERVDLELDDKPKLNLRNHLNVPGDVETDSLKPDDNSGHIGFNSNRISSLSDGTNAQDAATVSQLLDVSGDNSSRDNIPAIDFRASNDASLNAFWDSNNNQFVVDYSVTNTNTQDPFDLYVNGSFIEANIEDMDFIEGNSINLTGNSPSFEDGELTIAVDESSIDHNNLTNSGQTDAHHIRPSAGTLLTEDASQNFNVDESNINHNNLTNSSDSDAHHTRPSAGSGLTDSSNTFNVNAGNALNINNDDLDVDESAINHNNLTNSGDSDAHHIRPSAGSALAEDASQNFNFNGNYNVEDLQTTGSADYVPTSDGAGGLTMAQPWSSSSGGGGGLFFNSAYYAIDSGDYEAIGTFRVASGDSSDITKAGVMNDLQNAPTGLKVVVRDVTNGSDVINKNSKLVTGSPLGTMSGAADFEVRIVNDTSDVQVASVFVVAGSDGGSSTDTRVDVLNTDISGNQTTVQSDAPAINFEKNLQALWDSTNSEADVDTLTDLDQAHGLINGSTVGAKGENISGVTKPAVGHYRVVFDPAIGDTSDDLEIRVTPYYPLFDEAGEQITASTCRFAVQQDPDGDNTSEVSIVFEDGTGSAVDPSYFSIEARDL